MILVGDVLVDESIIHAKFACNTSVCKGACCTLEGGGGAPLTDEEAKIMRNLGDAVSPYLSDRSRKIVQNRPVEGLSGDYSTTCIDNRACCFVYHDKNGIAKCSIESAFFDGKTDFRKPTSCHLFPLRVGEFGGSYLYYEHFDECNPGREHGAKHQIFLLDVLQPALKRAFGEQWVNELNRQVDARRTENNSSSENNKRA